MKIHRNLGVFFSNKILNYQGKGHSVGIHTKNSARSMELGIELPVCSVIVNQAHAFATGGSFTNGLPFSLSMGCGTWGKNSIDDNLNYKHFINITKISTVIPGIEPKLKDFFEEYCNKYHPKELKIIDQFVDSIENNKEHFEYIRSYSPYHNIKKMNYPNLLLVTNLKDVRVIFDEPTKFTAKLRQYKTDKNLLLLKCELEDAGHGGKSGRDSAIEEIAFDYSFILKITKKFENLTSLFLIKKMKVKDKL